MRRFVRSLVLPMVLAGTCVTSLRAQTVRGEVADRGTGKPVPDGELVLLTDQRLGIAQGKTDHQGRFVIVAPGPGRYRLQFQRPGYRLLVTPVFDLRAGEAVDYALQVSSLPPVALDTAIIEGEVVPRRLEGFYRRRNMGFGTFMTHDDFDRWYPMQTTDIIRHAQVFDIVPNLHHGRDGDFRTYKILSRRGLPDGMGPIGQECPPLIFVDGTFSGNARDVDVDDFLSVTAIEALEFYEGGVQVPAEFQANGSSCGVIAIWSRLEGGEVARVAHRLELGGQVGGHLGADGLADGRLGLQASVGLVGPIEFYPLVNVFIDSWHGAARPRSGWQMLFAIRARPLGANSRWYLGSGLTSIQLTEQTAGNAFFRPQTSEEHFVVLTGVKVPLPWVHPVIEVQAVDALHPSRAELHFYTALTFRLN